MAAPTPLPPRPEPRPRVLEAHGDTRTDPWYWLRDRDDPAVLEHLRAENEYAAARLAPLAPLEEELYREIKARIEESDMSVPVRRGPWWYYQRTEEGRQYPIHCRLSVVGDEPPVAVTTDPAVRSGETVILDENDLDEGGYLRVANLAASPDHSLLAYGVDRTGSELYELSFRALDGSDTIFESVPATYYGLAWANDNATVFYTRVDAAMRPFQVWRHHLGSDAAGDELVFEERDERFTVALDRTKDGVFVVVYVSSLTTSECRVLPADDPNAELRTVLARRTGIEYTLEHHDGWFVLLTNDDAEDFRVLATPAVPDAGTPVELLSHRPGVRVEDVDVFDGWLVVSERLDAQPVVRVIEIPSRGVGALAGTDVIGASRIVPAPGGPSVTWEGLNPEPATTSLRIEQTSLVEPRTVSDYDFGSGAVRVRKRQPVLGGYDPAAYRTYRLWAEASDGSAVPVSVVHRAEVADGTGRPPAEPAPCLLYGYGAYEQCIDPVFSSLRLSLLDRGFIFAIAHVRGGGELGRGWYLRGKKATKPNTFSDFVACARHLVSAGFTTPAKLAARGRSAGGLLMGAIVNEAPELFAAVVAEVPFVDALTTMLDESIPLTVGEFDEWGDPIRDAAAYATIRSYSPYDNVAEATHPRLYVTGGLNDPRVGFWEPAKWVTKLRAVDPRAEVVLRTELGAGHSGPSGRYDAWRDEARVYAFVLDALGVVTTPAPM